MPTTLEFPDLLALIDERSAAFRAAVGAAPSLEVQVPTCPDWKLLDLAQHLGRSHRRWAATVAAGPADARPDESVWEVTPPDDRASLLAWSAESTQLLLSALRQTGPDRGCWTWWDRSESPQTCGAVARHQVQHVTVHTYDAQIAQGPPEPLPAAAALDGVEEFLSTACAGAYRWPHEPSVVDYEATEGRSWRLSLAAEGARSTRLPAPGTVPAGLADEDLPRADASVRGSASDLVLFLYGRITVDSLELAGDGRIFDQLIAWDPDA